MRDEINSIATSLISLLEKSNEKSKGQTDSNLENLKGTSMILDLGEVKNLKTFNTDGYGKKFSAFASLEEGYIGLKPSNYVKLQDLVVKILDLAYISDKADYEFIEDEIFNWLIICYEDKRIKQEFIEYLQDKIDSSCKEYIFYFKVLAIAIEDSFNIGNVEISHLSESKIQSELNSIKELKKDNSDELNSFFDEFKEPVLARFKTKGVKTKAQNIAMTEVELAVNALKCLFTNESLHKSYQIFDVDFNFNTNDFSSFIFETTKKEFDFQSSLNRKQGGHPILIDKKKLDDLNKSGLKRFSEFLKSPKSGSLYLEILDGINHLGKAISTRDLYERVVQLISFFERFLVPKDNSKAYGQKRFKDNLLPKMPYIKDLENYRKYVNQFYRVRDKYLHNKIRLPINLQDLFYFQRLATLFLIFLMELNKDYKEIEELLEFIEITGANTRS